MLDVGFERELGEIVQFLPPRDEVPRQTLLFSATIPQNVVSLARTYVDGQNFEFVQTVKGDETPTHEKIPQFILPAKGYANLYPSLVELLRREAQQSKEDSETMPLKAIIFFPTTAMVEMTSVLFSRLRRQNPWLPPIGHIHSKLTQAKRTFAADSFRRTRSGILFSSDVTARGMDFPDVSHVIQMCLPRIGNSTSIGLDELQSGQGRAGLAHRPRGRHGGGKAHSAWPSDPASPGTGVC